MKRKKLSLKKKEIFSLVILLLLLFVLFLSLDLVQKIQFYLSQALGRPADIVVDVSTNQGPITPIWQALAQGGEEKDPFDKIIKETTALKPKYIRLDHIYDFYDVVRKENGQVICDWTKLDKTVDQILEAGALPFFSLSYMPPAIAKDGQILNPPVEWADWSTVVRETVQHYSGRQRRNLKNIVYEVWNEPDLFGNWKIGRGKDYRLLYQYAIIGTNQAKDTQPFRIGGPATTAPYRAWTDRFLDYVKANRLRIDFYSWHRYSLRPEDFLDDINQIDSWLFKNAGFNLEKYLTEWSSVSENSPYHDTNFNAAHLVATVRQLLQRVDLAFTFEIKDGPSPEGKKYWGRWGLLTHEKAGPVEKKPKYYALQLLNRITGDRISLEGEGTWVTGFAAKESNKVKMILVNFDKDGYHFEKFPLTINNLANGTYTYEETFLTGVKKSLNITITDNRFKKELSLTSNNVVVIELEKT